jgi:hypothetical protein
MDTHNNSKRPAAEAVSFAAPTVSLTSNNLATASTSVTTTFGFDAIIAPQKKSKTAATDNLYHMTATLRPTEEGTIEDLFASACTMSDAPPEEISNKDAFLACLREMDRSLDGVSEQAHQLPKGWDERKQSAVEKTLQELAKIPRASMNDDDEESEDSDPFGRTTISAPTVGLSLDEKKFIEALPFCIPLDSGFHVVRPNASEICHCPCGPNLQPWRQRYTLHISHICGKNTKKFTPNALMDHLKVEGGCYEAKTQGMVGKVQYPLNDIYHHATRTYLQHLYGDWFKKGFAHKALHPVGSDNHKRAVNEEIRRIEREVVVGKRQLRKVEEEQEKLRVELEKKEKELSLLDEDRRETMKRTDALRERFQVQRRDKPEGALSDHQLAKFEMMTSKYFELKKLQVGTLEDDVVKFEVKHEVGDTAGFSLQNFFDENFDNAHSVLFKDETDNQSIARAVLATWDIIYDAKGDYEQSEGRSSLYQIHYITSTISIIEFFFHPHSCSSASKEEGTAVDQGGPSRQFLTDVFKQIDMLSVKVGNESVNIFENTDSGVFVLTDELLKNNIHVAAKRSGAKKKEKVAAIKRAKDYVRAVGRIIIHSMANKYILPAKALPPFFMTGESFDGVVIMLPHYFTTNSPFSNLLGCVPSF